MIRSAPSCLAASTPSRPTAPSPTTATVFAGLHVGGDGAEPAGAQHVRGGQQRRHQIGVGDSGVATRVPSASGMRKYWAWAPLAPTNSRWMQLVW
jgi:hypothetical protein